MKRFLTLTGLAVVLSSLILGASGCAAATNGNNSAATNANLTAPANANANASASATGGATADEIIAKEKQLWDALKKRDYEAFGKMLSSDNVYISSDVVGGKDETVNGVREFAPTEVNLSDWKTLVLDADTAVVTYTVDARGTSGGQPLPPGKLRASTAWVKRGGEWLAVYHQDCFVEERPSSPPPTAGTSKPAGGAANTNTAAPAASPVGGGAADDPVAGEKSLWDALKRKDWDTFAAGLAEDQIEVEPTGVYDKAGTLAAVKTFDFTNLVSSDFKATKFDDDATLVTYTVKGPGADGKPMVERASSIWVKRDGKWLAVFHHGTPVMQMPAK
jgi:hypothetical protein